MNSSETENLIVIFSFANTYAEHLSPIEDEVLLIEEEVKKLKQDVTFVYNQERRHRNSTCLPIPSKTK